MKDIAKISDVLKLLEDGFFEEDALRPQIRVEVPLGLAYALEAEDVGPNEVLALAFALRDVTEAAPFDEHAALSKAQLDMLNSILGEEALPAPLGEILRAGLDRLERRADLYALYGMIYGTYERYDVLADLETLASLPVPANDETQAPRA